LIAQFSYYAGLKSSAGLLTGDSELIVEEKCRIINQFHRTGPSGARELGFYLPPKKSKHLDSTSDQSKQLTIQDDTIFFIIVNDIYPAHLVFCSRADEDCQQEMQYRQVFWLNPYPVLS